MKDLFNELTNTNPKVSTTIAFIIGLVLTADLNATEQNMLGDFIFLIGQTIITNSSSQRLIESKINSNMININSNNFKNKYNPLIYDINKIKKIINELYPNSDYELNLLSKTINDLQNKISILKKD